jgi:hypothetical protein
VSRPVTTSAAGSGLELDAELHGHFFRDEDVADFVPTGVDLNTRAALACSNLVVPYCLRGDAGTWCPSATAGLGIIHAMFDGVSHAPGTSSFDRTQTDLALDAGVGVMHALTRWSGVRVEARYFHAFVDESSGTSATPRTTAGRVSVGFTFCGPQVAQPSPGPGGHFAVVIGSARRMSRSIALAASPPTTGAISFVQYFGTSIDKILTQVLQCDRESERRLGLPFLEYDGWASRSNRSSTVDR